MIVSNSAWVRPLASLLSAFTLLLAAPSLTQAQSAPVSPTGFLKWSMDKYAGLATYQADCAWKASFSGQPGVQGTKRALWFKKPNLFKVVTAHSGNQMVMTSISDGKKVVEFATGVPSPAMSYPAPRSIAEADSMQMGHPMFGGSLLYKFFGGSAKYAALVDEGKMRVMFGSPVKLDGQDCKTVKFYAQGPTYGKMEIAIGVKDGLVRRIRYGSEPLLEMIRQQAARAGQSGNQKAVNAMKNIPTSSTTTESYSRIVTGKAIAPAVFAAKAPAGMPMQDVGGGSEPQPPVPLGKPAPNFSVTDLNGVKRKLADFRGKVVLIDFWATWCPPCIKGLPETQKFHTDYGKKGLAVLTISDEDKATVQPFIRQNRFTFPVYLDAGSAAKRAYNVQAIPTMVIIDKSGKLVSYKVGLAPREDIVAALKKAGLAIR